MAVNVARAIQSSFTQEILSLLSFSMDYLENIVHLKMSPTKHLEDQKKGHLTEQG